MTRHQLLIVIGCCFLSALLSMGALLLWQTAVAQQDLAYHKGNAAYIENRTALPNFFAAASSAKPAVVHLKTFASMRAQRAGASLSSGSGVLVSADGYLVTNYHVVKNAQVIQISLQDGQELLASVVGVDEATDLALLRLPDGDWPYLPFGNSDSLAVGEWVLAIGNPFNLANTVTLGIVSAKDRAIDVLEGEDRIESFIQTDAAVNPGNSGGALVNTAGELVGINTAIMTKSGRNEGFAFAIPGNLVQLVLNDLKAYGRVDRAVMGVYVEAISNAKAKSIGLARQGLLIKRLKKEGAAEKAGLQSGDVLLEINGQQVNNPAEMQLSISRLRPGDRVQVRFVRDGLIRTLSLQLGGEPAAISNQNKALPAASNRPPR